ncbi:hypothetical protein TRICI_005299 [Trichomonascus ciferrii]|uniref:Uncharacterized protein n=1 Tax=Trichomonascus ciferrii TaxID=44093 RepID=A0A642UU26_9ASCO|nr:hypothetical protein TRICI_005299 [Trichomonascus ciferrii]
MSSYKARERILDAYHWEDVLRRAIIDDEPALLKDIEERIHAYEEEVKRRPGVKSKPVHRNQRHKGPQDPLQNYNKPPEGVQLRMLQEDNKRLTYKRRVLRNFPDRLSKKVELDELYMDIFLIPEYRRQREMSIMNTRRMREMAKPPASRITHVTTPIGPFSLLQVSGYKQSPILGMQVRKALSDKRQQKIAKLEEYLKYAKQQAVWEKEIEKSRKHLETLTKQWCEPIEDAIARMKRGLERDRNRYLTYRKVLIRRKQMLQPILAKRHENKIKQWQNYNPPPLHPLSKRYK